MKTSYKILLVIAFSIVIVFLGILVGSGFEKIDDIFSILAHRIFGLELKEGITKVKESIIFDVRIPRVLLAFLVGGMLSVSGVVIQSVLKNPIASPFTLGVSSGASLGIGFLVLFGTYINYFTYQVFGFIFSVIAIFIVMFLSQKIDRGFSNNTIILIGMIVSLFLNSILVFITSIKYESISSILIWQMGSFSSRGFKNIIYILPLFLVCMFFIMRYSREMDILTFGDEMSKTIGVDTKKVKIKLLVLSCILTSLSISTSGIIGFVDLIVPNISRRIFSCNHVILTPVSFFIGGGFMVIFDIISRTVVYPSEIPIGVVNSIIGTPIFCYIFFKNNKAGVYAEG